MRWVLAEDDPSSSGEQGVDVREEDVSYLGHPLPSPLPFHSVSHNILFITALQ